MTKMKYAEFGVLNLKTNLMNFFETFWNHKYLSGETGWDIGYVSTPLKEYIDQLTDKNIKILIPGGGNSYEAEYLLKKGFNNVFVVDLSSIPLKNLSIRVPLFPKENLLHLDFFDLKETFDLILEQTFFCAIEPSLREKYISKMSQLLNPKGKLVGLLFKIPLHNDTPPFGGNKEEYLSLFKEKLEIILMETTYNSIPERAGTELFFILQNDK